MSQSDHLQGGSLSGLNAARNWVQSTCWALPASTYGCAAINGAVNGETHTVLGCAGAQLKFVSHAGLPAHKIYL